VHQGHAGCPICQCCIQFGLCGGLEMEDRKHANTNAESTRQNFNGARSGCTNSQHVANAARIGSRTLLTSTLYCDGAAPPRRGAVQAVFDLSATNHTCLRAGYGHWAATDAELASLLLLPLLTPTVSAAQLHHGRGTSAAHSNDLGVWLRQHAGHQTEGCCSSGA
jgi:hypothetical protein